MENFSSSFIRAHTPQNYSSTLCVLPVSSMLPALFNLIQQTQKSTASFQVHCHEPPRRLEWWFCQCTPFEATPWVTHPLLLKLNQWLLCAGLSSILLDAGQGLISSCPCLPLTVTYCDEHPAEDYILIRV